MIKNLLRLRVSLLYRYLTNYNGELLNYGGRTVLQNLSETLTRLMIVQQNNVMLLFDSKILIQQNNVMMFDSISHPYRIT
jgi:hypothetical protein